MTAPKSIRPTKAELRTFVGFLLNDRRERPESSPWEAMPHHEKPAYLDHAFRRTFKNRKLRRYYGDDYTPLEYTVVIGLDTTVRTADRVLLVISHPTNTRVSFSADAAGVLEKPLKALYQRVVESVPGQDENERQTMINELVDFSSND